MTQKAWNGKLPRHGFGSAAFARLHAPVSEADAAALLDAVTTSPDPYIDTAPFYGFGLAEQRIGDFLRTHPDRHPVISTKVGRRLEPRDEGAEPSFVFDYTTDGIRSTVKDSLQRLGRSSVDLLLLHDIGKLVQGANHPQTMDTVEREAWPLLREFQAEGVTRGIGLGVVECDVVLECLDRGLIPDAVLLAGRYTLLDRSAETTGLLERCLAHGVTLIAAAPFNGGLLAGGARFNYSTAKPEMLAIRQRLADVCADFNVPLPAAAVQFPLQHPAVSSIVAGAHSAASFREQSAWINHPIPDALWPALEAARAAPAA